MGYYRGDHYRSGYRRGDYYRGDPGFFSLIGKAIKGAVRVVGGAAMGFITGGGIKGAIGGAIAGTGHAIVAGTREETLAAGGSESAYTPDVRAAHEAALANPPALRVPGAGMALPMIQGPGGAMTMMRGLHPNKSTYVTRGGGTSRWPQQLVIHAKHSELVKSRRMNVGNARALRRSLRRLSGFAKLARRVLVVQHRYKKTRHAKRK
jgi:hypothetical protein